MTAILWGKKVGERVQAIKGMNDILPDETIFWAFVEDKYIKIMEQYGYQEIRMPIAESTSLFKRSIGEVTDIVEKEMYTFTDLNGESITLRPEGTAGCVRACLEHGLLHNKQQKLWYMGPMFRHEKPQKGRYRQFYQFGVEAFGFPQTGIELELLAMTARFWKSLGIFEHLSLEINTLGVSRERQIYRQALVDFFKANYDHLDEDSKRRLSKNPLRILDSKNPELQSLLANAPKLIDFLSVESNQHFEDFCKGLDALKIPYKLNPRLVRGLDYYNHTVFEWVTDKLGSQATVCGGGRYDGLVAELGGDIVPCFGFSMGVERLILLLNTLEIGFKPKPTFGLFLMASDDLGIQKALVFAESLRDFNPNWVIHTNTLGGSFKSQFKKADKSLADFAIIFGEEELQKGEVSVKNLRLHEPQLTLSQEKLLDYLLTKFEEQTGEPSCQFI